MGKKRIRQKITHEMPPVGTRLRGKVRGREVYAEIISNPESKAGKSILFEGNIYHSMTAAAQAVTGYSVNGWRFWEII